MALKFLNNGYFAGKVGIGTASPLGELHVKNVSELYTDLDGSDAAVNFLDNNLDVWRIGIRASDNSFRFSQDATSLGTNVRVTIADGGNVGIGTTSPGTALQVGGLDDGSNYDITLGWNAVDSEAVGTKRSAITFKTTQAAVNNEDIYKWDIAMLAAPATVTGEEFGSDLAFLRSTRGSTATDATTMILTRTGNVGIGITSPGAKLEINDTNKAINTKGNLFVSTTDALAVDKGGQISLGGVWSGTSQIQFAGIAGRKENATSGNAGGYLQLSTTNSAGGNLTERMRITSAGNVGIGTTTPKAKLDVNGRFCVDSKTHNLTNAFTTCLTVNLSSHTGCYVTLTCFGDWGSHSAAAYRGEFFLQNGANAYAEPGIILRQDDNTSNGADQIVCQILDPTGTGNPKDFEIQIRTTATTGTTSFTGQLTYTVQGQFNSIT